MRQDLLSITTRPQPLRLVFLQQPHHDVCKVVRVVDFILSFVREDDLTLLDLQKEQLPLAVVEWCHTDKHLVYDDAYGPPVNGEVMTLVGNHLWGKVLGSATESLRKLPLLQGFCQAVVDNFQETVFVDEDVLELKIAMHNTLAMEVTYSKDNLRSVEANNILGEALSRLENLVQFSAADEGHHEVETFW